MSLNQQVGIDHHYTCCPLSRLIPRESKRLHPSFALTSNRTAFTCIRSSLLAGSSSQPFETTQIQSRKVSEVHQRNQKGLRKRVLRFREESEEDFKEEQCGGNKAEGAKQEVQG